MDEELCGRLTGVLTNLVQLSNGAPVVVFRVLDQTPWAQPGFEHPLTGYELAACREWLLRGLLCHTWRESCSLSQDGA